MSEGKHTPWRVVAHEGRSPRGSDALAFIADAEGRYVAQWVPRRHENLLAAAPDLAAALEELTAACEADFIGDGDDPMFGDDEGVAWSQGGGDDNITFGMIRRARAAIARAYGKEAPDLNGAAEGDAGAEAGSK